MSLSISEYLYPELMSTDGLIQTLKQRYVKVDSLESMEKQELVDLYNTYILPLPQRKYRLNRRGREMTKKQAIASKKRKAEAKVNATDESIPQKRKSTSKLLTSFDPPPAVVDRIKPPPSCVNFQKKTIKLGSTSTTVSVSPVSSSLNKLKLSKPSGDSGDSPTKKPRTTLSQSETGLGKVITIKLINSHLQSNKCDKDTSGEKPVHQPSKDERKSDTPMDTSDSTTSVPEVKERKKIKIKRIPIAWP